MIDTFLIGTWTFWSLLLGASLFILWALERESGWQAFFSLAVTVAVLVLANDVNVLTWVRTNVNTVLLAFLGYIVVGTGWGIVKWWLYVTGKREKLDEDIAALRANFKTRPEPELRVAMARLSLDAPQASEHKARILLWMTYWPWSATWTLINDPVRRAFRYAYTRIAGMLQGISDRAYRDVPRIP